MHDEHIIIYWFVLQLVAALLVCWACVPAADISARVCPGAAWLMSSCRSCRRFSLSSCLDRSSSGLRPRSWDLYGGCGANAPGGA